ncbi:hypothetical protein EVAR_58560_1 [Eumeta japonica]|uniref:Uncharacterized protein n=1 Tax=Eumeta variegata TaxID=151549 RepID=A0A4C1YHJ2_EUMVA|nr:hypothetical protein EVAR_58560_1 [Eumeta japonica]
MLETKFSESVKTKKVFSQIFGTNNIDYQKATDPVSAFEAAGVSVGGGSSGRTARKHRVLRVRTRWEIGPCAGSVPNVIRIKIYFPKKQDLPKKKNLAKLYHPDTRNFTWDLCGVKGHSKAMCTNKGENNTLSTKPASKGFCLHTETLNTARPRESRPSPCRSGGCAGASTRSQHNTILIRARSIMSGRSCGGSAGSGVVHTQNMSKIEVRTRMFCIVSVSVQRSTLPTLVLSKNVQRRGNRGEDGRVRRREADAKGGDSMRKDDFISGICTKCREILS